MKTRYSFYFQSGQMEKFHKIVPASLRARFVRQFIKNEYLAPVNIESLKEIEDGEIFPVLLDETCVKKIDTIQNQLQSQFSVNVSKSAIMRDVLDSILEKYTEEISEPERKNIPFYVPVGIMEKLDKFISSNERSATISEFILNDYHTKGSDLGELKKKTSEVLEKRMFNLEITAIEKLDEFADKFNVKRSVMFRAALNQMLYTYESSGIYHEQLQYEMKTMLDKLTDFMTPSEIKDLVTGYFTNKKEEPNMVYKEKKEVLLSPENEREVEYEVADEKNKKNDTTTKKGS